RPLPAPPPELEEVHFAYYDLSATGRARLSWSRYLSRITDWWQRKRYASSSEETTSEQDDRYETDEAELTIMQRDGTRLRVSVSTGLSTELFIQDLVQHLHLNKPGIHWVLKNTGGKQLDLNKSLIQNSVLDEPFVWVVSDEESEASMDQS